KGNVGPGPIVTCPAQGNVGKISSVKDPMGRNVFTPVPAIMTDNNFASLNRGYIVGTPGGQANYIDLIPVKEGTLGNIGLGTVSMISVPAYSVPANAPQCQNGPRLSTLDGRLEHAVEGKDPVSGTLSVWTAHAVFGGAGS